MTQPRKELISVTETPYYHCSSRYVRQALCANKAKVFISNTGVTESLTGTNS